MDIRYPSFSLEGRRALVTGASRGIGQILALGLAHAGADVIVTARRAEDLATTVTAISDLGRRALPLALDVTQVSAISRVIATASAQLGGLDILVNNAGMEQVCDSLHVDETLWDRIVDTNLKGAFFCAQAAAHAMVQGGAIINLCSLTSGIGIPTAVAYGASKTGLLGMTRALASEWAPRHIRVNAIAPGYFRTQMTEVFYQNDDWQRSMLAKIPQGRFGQLEDLIGVAVFLSAEASAYITGQMLYVDGGFMASV